MTERRRCLCLHRLGIGSYSDMRPSILARRRPEKVALVGMKVDSSSLKLKAASKEEKEDKTGSWKMKASRLIEETEETYSSKAVLAASATSTANYLINEKRNKYCCYQSDEAQRRISSSLLAKKYLAKPKLLFLKQHCRVSLNLLAIISLLCIPLLANSNNTPPSAQTIEGCKFYPVGENRRFERVAENLPVGSEIFKLEAHPRSEFKIEPVDNSLSDVNYFKYVDIDDRFVAIKLNQSLEDLVDRRDPQNVLKFKLTCRGIGSQEDSFLPVTVYIHDVNDHAPEFQNVPYHLEVDELTPVGLTIFRSIHAIDRDKPNTANSDITYSIVGGNDNDSFILSDPIEGILVMNKALDYDHGNREYKIQIQASDHGTPALSSVTTMTVKVKDADDQNPIFSHEIYSASVSESAQITGKRIRDKVRVEPAIQAYDQDRGISARLRYSIILGNEGGFFEMNAQSGELFLIREIDLEKLANPTLSLQIQASQVDNPFRQALARVDIAVQDINDNSPEFEYDMYNITVIENLPPGFTVLQVFATDSDQGENAQFKYVLHDDSGAFKIDPANGWISVKDPTRLDRESTDKIRMHVTTLERKPNVNPDIGKRKRGTSVEINLLDSNDNTPFFVGAAQPRLKAPSDAADTTAGEGDISTQLQANACLNVTSGAQSSQSDQAAQDCVVPINLYNFNVLETATPGTQIGHVYAYDRDLADNGRVQYFKQNDSISLSAPFDVNPLNGSVYVLAQFTRLPKKQASYTLFVKAIDSAPIHFERRHSVAVVQINVTDINNSVPEFIGTTPFEAYVGESLPEGAFVTQIYAKDDDSITEQLEYSIVAGNDEKLFIIDSKLGKIYTASVLDFERKQAYDLLVQVSDGVNTAVAPLIINIIDINDQQPLFTHQFYNFTVLEESGANQTVGQMSAMDRDSGKNAQLTYSLVGEHANDAFYLDPASGLMRTRRSLDCELEPVIDFLVVARDAGIPQLSGSANVRVRVEDLNDWAPRFEQARYEIEVLEELDAPVDIYQIKANDRDRDENAIIKYLIVGGNELNLFNINADTGLISSAARLDYESKREHRLQVAARNVRPFQGPQARSIVNPAVEILIKVQDINDELVTFERSSYHWKVSELAPKGSILGRVNASNLQRAQLEQDITYWLGPVQVLSQATAAAKRRQPPAMSGVANDSSHTSADQSMVLLKSATSFLTNKLKIDEKSGEIQLLETINRDPPANEQLFRFSVFARDKRSISKLNASIPIVIDVLDVNDNAPTFDEITYNLEMPENLPAGTTIPTFFKVQDVDSGLNGRISSYYINGSREELDLFHINNQTGTITLKNPLDYEKKSIHKFEIVAVDGGQGADALAGSAQVVIQVANINEFSPKFINLPYEYQLQENAVPGTQVGQVKAIDQDGNKVGYSISDGDTEFFAIEPQTGRIYVSRQLLPRTQYSFIVRATDDGQPQNYSLGVQVLIKVRDTNDYAPIFTSNSYLGTVIEKSTLSGAGSSSSNNHTLVKVEAVDKDLQNNTITYSIISGNEEGIFAIEKRSGEIRVATNQAHRIDYDKRRQYTLLVQAQDSHESPLQGLTMVQLEVLDVNDHPPVFSKAAYVASIAENAPAGTCFFRLEADARDSKDIITYSLSGSGNAAAAISSLTSSARSGTQTNTPLFEIHPTKGTLCSRVPLDREQRATYELTVTANDGRFESHAPISVEVLDENDNKPAFDQDHYTVSIPYDSQPGRPVISVHANDPDANANGNLQYWIKNTHGLFQIDAETGQIRVVTRLPQLAQAGANQTTTFELRLFAQDQGTSPQIGEASLLIKLTNNENHPPKFDRFAYQTSVDENVSGLPLIQVQASDPDPGKAGKIVYRLVRVQSTSLLRLSQKKPESSGSLQTSQKQQQQQQQQQQLQQDLQQENMAANLDYLRSAFKIDRATGKVTLVEPLDYEETHSVELLIEARDEALTDAQSTLAFVQVQVNDVNDNKPEFLAMPKLLRVPSSTEAQTEIIYTLQASDADSSASGNNLIEYRLEHPSRYFQVHPQTGALTAALTLPSSVAELIAAGIEVNGDSQQQVGGAIYSEILSVIAENKATGEGSPLYDKSQIELEVYKDQADDGRPIFSSNQYFVQSERAIEPGTVILIPRATVPNGDQVIYNITAIDTGKQSSSSNRATGGARSLVKRFAIDTESGRISTTSKLEANELAFKNLFHFIVKATNKLNPALSSEAGVIVRLWDTNTRCPRFPFTEYYASIPESARLDSIVVPNLVIDEVERFAGQKLSYQITEDNSNDNFFIDVAPPVIGNGTLGSRRPLQVSLRIKKPLDRESMPKFLGGIYTLSVSASNSKCASQAKVKILIEDQNDNSPLFERSEYLVELRENSPIGHVITQLQASDADELDTHKLRYFIAEGTPEKEAFEMEQKTGSISVKRELDREKAASYLLRVMALDQANNTGWTSVQVNVLDENDWAPTFSNETFIMEAIEGPASVGTRIRLPVFDFDDGLNRQMEVYIVEGNSGNEFRLDVDEGGPLLSIVQELDWEKFTQKEQPSGLARWAAQLGPRWAELEQSGAAMHVVQVAAKDKGTPARIGKTSVLVLIRDINDNPPKFVHESYYEFIDESAPVGSQVVSLKATDADSPMNTNLTYAFVLRNQRPARTAVATSLSSAPAHRTTRQVSAGETARQPFVANTAGAQQLPIPFSLDPFTGIITVARQLDISEQQQYTLTVEAFDGLWHTETQVRVFVNEMEDPRDVSARSSEATSHYRFQVAENAAEALVGIVDLKPRKLRVNSQMKYSIVNGEMRQLFRISQAGEIFTLRGLDREQRAQYTFTVMLEERRASSKLTVAEVIVDVLDENDEIPTFTHVYHGTIRENSPPNTPVFLLPTTSIRATDNDTKNNSQIRYSLQGSGSDRFIITNSGSVVFRPADESQLLDRELRAEYKLDVQASDSGNLSSKTSLTIKVEDENDNAPIFETGPLFVLIPETARAGSRIVQVKARDRDEPGPNSEIHYKISSSNFQQSQQQQPQQQLSDLIRIDQSTGELFVVGQLQPASTYNITVAAVDSGGLSAQTQVNVTVIDVNDHKPKFERPSYQFVVLEGNYSKSALKLGTLKANDADIGRNSQIEYLLITDPQYEASLPVANPAAQLASLLSSSSSSRELQQQAAAGQQAFPLSIDVHTGELFARGLIDREQRDSYVFKVLAIDMGEPPMNSTCEVSVKVKDTNDEPPRFYTDPYLALVPENLEPGHKVTQIAAFDPDTGENGQVFYKLGEGHEGKFYIDGKDGTVWTLASLDYEQKNFYNITIIAYDRGSPSLHSSAKLWITVADMNDAVPNFAKAMYTLEVAENAKLGDTIFALNAGKGAFKYSWVSGGGSGVNNNRDVSSNQNGGTYDEIGMDTFTIEPTSGHIKLAKPLDSVQRNHYRLMVKAQDESEPPKFDTAEINILVGTGQGVRLFAQRVYEVSVPENQLAPLVLIDLNSTDEMIHQPVQYSIVGTDHRGLFKIEPDTGRLSVTSSLDRERRDSYTLKIKAETGNLNIRQRRDTSASRPQLAVNRPLNRWSASTLTSSTTRAPLGGARRHFNGLLGSDLADYETRSQGQSARLLAGSFLSGQNSTSGSSILQSFHLAYDETFVSVLVEDENDNSPVFSNKGKPLVAAVPLEASFGYEVARCQAYDVDWGLNAQLRYEIQSRVDDASTKFYIDPSTGVVRSMVNFALDSGRVYNFDVRATDRDGQDSGNSATKQVFVYVLPETKMVLMVTDTEPIVMEKRAHEVIGYLSNITGFDVKMAKLEPHIEGESPEPFSTDMFLYAVNPSLNNIVDTETLLSVFRQSSQTILSHLHTFKIRRIQGVTVQEKISQMGATEVAIIALSTIVFLGSILAILLLCSCNRSSSRTKASNSSREAIWNQQRVNTYGGGLKSALMSDGSTVGDQEGSSNKLVGSQRSGSAGSSTGSPAGPNGATQIQVGSANGNGAYLLANGSAPRQHSNSTYSTGDGANSSEYMDSLISYKRSSGAGSTSNQRANAVGNTAIPGDTSQVLSAGARSGARETSKTPRDSDWATMNSDLAAVINEHHFHHLQQHNHLHHHHHPNLRAPNSQQTSLVDPLVKGPRARLAVNSAPSLPKAPSSTERGDSNTEVHSDQEVFDDEDEDEQQQIPIGSENLNRRSSVRSADRSMYSGDSNWDTGDEADEHHQPQQSRHPHNHPHQHRHHHHAIDHQHHHHKHTHHPHIHQTNKDIE